MYKNKCSTYAAEVARNCNVIPAAITSNLVSEYWSTIRVHGAQSLIAQLDGACSAMILVLDDLNAHAAKGVVNAQALYRDFAKLSGSRRAAFPDGEINGASSHKVMKEGHLLSFPPMSSSNYSTPVDMDNGPSPGQPPVDAQTSNNTLAAAAAIDSVVRHGNSSDSNADQVPTDRSKDPPTFFLTAGRHFSNVAIDATNRINTIQFLEACR